MNTKTAKKPRAISKQPKTEAPSGPFLTEKHDCALFKRKGNMWRWEQGGKIQRYPKFGEPVIVAYSKTSFSYTSAIIDIISIDESEANSTQVVFQDKDAVWMLEFPTHVNDTKAIKKALRKPKEKKA